MGGFWRSCQNDRRAIAPWVGGRPGRSVAREFEGMDGTHRKGQAGFDHRMTAARAESCDELI
jgi:hypothetical protein